MPVLRNMDQIFFTAHITGDLMIFTEDNEYVLLHLQMTY